MKGVEQLVTTLGVGGMCELHETDCVHFIHHCIPVHCAVPNIELQHPGYYSLST